MENGKWKMENGKWKMENEKWKMEMEMKMKMKMKMMEIIVKNTKKSWINCQNNQYMYMIFDDLMISLQQWLFKKITSNISRFPIEKGQFTSFLREIVRNFEKRGKSYNFNRMNCFIII